jgi:hypothetical protein
MLMVIAGVALAGRAVYILTVTRHEHGFYDRVYYEGQAALLGGGHGFTSPPPFGRPGAPDALHPPLTGLALAPVAWATGDSVLAERFAVALAGVGVVVLVGLVGREVAGTRAGLLAAAVAAVYPNLWMNDGLVMSETFAALGTAAAVFCAYRLIRQPGWWNAAGAGVACALAMLSRSELALLVPVVVVPAALTIRGLGWDRRLRLAVVAVVASVLVVAPWVTFNLTRFDHTVLLASGDTGVLLGANCDQTYSGPLLGSWDGLCTFREYRGHTGAAAHQGTRSQALDYIGGHLDRLPAVVAARVGREWSVYRVFSMAHVSTTEGRPYWASIAGWACYLVLVGLAVPGALLLRRRRVPLIPILGPVVVVTLSAAAFYGLVRFRTPAEVSLVVLAAVTLDRLVARWRGEAVSAPAS